MGSCRRWYSGCSRPPEGLICSAAVTRDASSAMFRLPPASCWWGRGAGAWEGETHSCFLEYYPITLVATTTTTTATAETCPHRGRTHLQLNDGLDGERVPTKDHGGLIDNRKGHRGPHSHAKHVAQHGLQPCTHRCCGHKPDLIPQTSPAVSKQAGQAITHSGVAQQRQMQAASSQTHSPQPTPPTHPPTTS